MPEEPAAHGPLSVLDRLTDGTGIIEHAWHSVPRYAGGYCTDDNGRALALVSEVGGDGAASFARRYLAFLVHAHLGDGRFRLRLGYDRRWTDDPPSEDADGRAIRGIATAAAIGPSPDVRATARALFEPAAGRDFAFWRAQASALVGTIILVETDPRDRGARDAAERWASTLPRQVHDDEWPWPEPRLGYENALLPHALLRAGATLDDPELARTGRRLLDWLVGVETSGSRFSFTPVGGRDGNGRQPAFDQQPIEAWAMAEAAAAALAVSGDPADAAVLDRAIAWFDGENDSDLAMIDPSTGGGFDGLERSGVNRNQGAESQLAALAVRHLADSHPTTRAEEGLRREEITLRAAAR
jgi:hypothetical protein